MKFLENGIEKIRLNIYVLRLHAPDRFDKLSVVHILVTRRRRGCVFRKFEKGGAIITIISTGKKSISILRLGWIL